MKDIKISRTFNMPTSVFQKLQTMKEHYGTTNSSIVVKLINAAYQDMQCSIELKEEVIKETKND